jgi:hypothetical protein
MTQRSIPSPRRLFAAAGACCAALLVAACGGDKVEEVSQSAQAAVLTARIEAVELEIGAKIGPAICVSNDDCRTLPMGALACGGPADYRVYSTQSTDVAGLQRLADEHQRLSRDRLALQQAVGPCVAALPPQTDCNRSSLNCRAR